MARATQTEGITGTHVRDALLKGFGERFIKLCIKTKQKVCDYNFAQVGDDRHSMQSIRCVLHELIAINPSGVFKKCVLQEGIQLLDTRFQGKLLKGWK